MAFMIGAFAGGLWKGASSAMSLASQYQAFQTQAAQNEAADKVAAAREEELLAKPQVDTTKTGAGAGTGTGDTGVGGDGTGTGTTDAGPVRGTGTGEGVTESALPGKSTWPPKRSTQGVPAPPEARPANQGMPGASQAPGAATAGIKGAPGGPSGDPVYGPAGPPSTATGTDAAPVTPTVPTTPVAPVAEAQPELTPEQRSGKSPLPVVRPFIQTDPTQKDSPLNRGALPQPTTSPATAISPTQMQTSDVPAEGYTPTQPAPPSVTAPAGGYLGTGAVGQVLSPVAGSTRANPPAPAQSSSGTAALNAIEAAKLQARKTGQDTPVQGQSMVAHPDGSIGSAPSSGFAPRAGGGGTGQQSAIPASNQFAGPGVPTGAGAGADTRAPAPEQVQSDVGAIQQGIQNARTGGRPAGTVAAAGPAAGTDAGATPPGTYDTPTPSAAALKPQTGQAPAEPPKGTAGQTQQTPGPVSVPATEGGPTSTKGGGAVVPGSGKQAGPSVQSEKTPAALAPQISPNFWSRLQKQDPEYAATVKRVVDKIGGGAVSYESVAAVLWRESRFQRQVGVAKDGDTGVMQVIPDTQRAMMRYLGTKVDPNSLEGSLTLGVGLLRYLAVDAGLGANTAQTHLAYMRGEGAVAEVSRVGVAQARQGRLRNALGWLDDMYEGKTTVNDTHFPGGFHGKTATNYSADQIISAGNGAGGPEALLNVVATTGPAGLPMSARWATAQAAVERAAIMKGDWNSLPHISEWFAQQSHQGAIANLSAAHAALEGGDSQGAMNALARAHAFFPDGVMGRFGVDKNNQMWGERFSEGTGERLGQPFKISSEDIVRQMIRLQNPNTYIKTLDEHRKTSAAISLDEARTKYEGLRPEVELEKSRIGAGGTVEAANIGARSREQIAAENRASREQIARENREGKTGTDYTASDQARANTETNSVYKDDNKPDDVDQGSWSAMSGLHRQLIMPSRSGGSALTSSQARSVADGVRTGNIRPKPIKDAQGNQGYGFYSKEDLKEDGSVKEGAHAHAYLPKAEGDQVLRGFAGARRVAPAKGGGGEKRAAIGSGLGTQYAQQQGYGMNLANQPQQPQASA